MNYITTDKHPYIKAGLRFIQQEGNEHEIKLYYLENKTSVKSHEIVILEWLKDGLIIEEQKPEFTKQDMLSFAQYFYSFIGVNNNDAIFNQWLIKRNEQA